MQKPFYKWRSNYPDWDCPYYNEDYYCCEKFGYQKCEPYTMKEVQQLAKTGFNSIDVSRVCSERLLFGNCYIHLSQDDINALKANKILCGRFNNEYGIFIVLESEDKEQ